MADVYFLVVDWANDYKNTPDFATKELRDQWFLDRSAAAASNQNVSYFRMYDTFRVAMPYNQISTYNYLFFEQDGKRWFYFINRVTYSNPNLQLLDVELDVLVTYMFDYTLQECYIERAHMPRVTLENNYYKRDFTNCLAPENISVPSTYEEIERDRFQYQTPQQTTGYWAWFVATSNAMNIGYNYTDAEGKSTFLKIEDTIFGVAQPLIIFAIPITPGEETSVTDSYVVQTYGAPGEQGNTMPLHIMQTLMQKTGSVADSIVFAGITPFCPGVMFNARTSQSPGGFAIQSDRARWYRCKPENVAEVNKYAVLVPNTKDIRCTYVPALPNPLRGQWLDIAYETMKWDPIFEPKLYTPPYTILSIEYLRGNDYILNPLADTIPDTIKPEYYLSMGSDVKDAFALPDYLSPAVLGTTNIDLIAPNDTVNELAIPSNAYNTYAYQRRASKMTGLSTSLAGSLAMAAISANPIGVGAAVLGTAASVVNMAVEEAQMKKIPPAIRKPGNNLVFELGTAGIFPNLVYQRLPNKYLLRLARYFTKFGYAVNDVLKYDTRSRRDFNYIKTGGAVITGMIPEEHKNRIRAAFDSGVTFWHVDRMEIEMYQYFESINPEDIH